MFPVSIPMSDALEIPLSNRGVLCFQFRSEVPKPVCSVVYLSPCSERIALRVRDHVVFQTALPNDDFLSRVRGCVDLVLHWNTRGLLLFFMERRIPPLAGGEERKLHLCELMSRTLNIRGPRPYHGRENPEPGSTMFGVHSSRVIRPH